MSILWKNAYPVTVDSYTQCREEIGRAYALRTPIFDFLYGQFVEQIRFGRGAWPYYVVDGALVEVRPTLMFLIRERKAATLISQKQE